MTRVCALSYVTRRASAPGGIRTHDLRLRRPTLGQRDTDLRFWRARRDSNPRPSASETDPWSTRHGFAILARSAGFEPTTFDFGDRPLVNETRICDFGAPGGIRTHDLRLRSPTLNQPHSDAPFWLAARACIIRPSTSR